MGGAGGAALAALGPQPRLNCGAGGIAAPGSAIPLTLILVSFALKYVGTVALAIDSDVSQRAVLVSAMTAVGGVFAGLFWGRTPTLFRRALAAAGERSDFASVAKLIWPRWEARLDSEAP